jgi:hypothetical protein
MLFLILKTDSNILEVYLLKPHYLYLSMKVLALFITMLMAIAAQKQESRTILIFADKGDNALLAQQLEILKADPGGLKNRDVVIKTLTYVKNADQYKTWHVVNNSPFTVILIGKDNGEKLRSHQPVTLKKLFDLIDSMPMRQNEMTNQR